MAQANHGDTVSVHYTGKLVDGTTFDSSVNGEPLQFKIGAGQIIPGFEEAVIGMKPGESVTTTISPENAYGLRDEALIRELEKDKLPDDLDPEVGQTLQSVGSDGSRLNLLVSKVSESKITLDANHPLAGKELVFDIELLEIVES